MIVSPAAPSCRPEANPCVPKTNQPCAWCTQGRCDELDRQARYSMSAELSEVFTAEGAVSTLAEIAISGLNCPRRPEKRVVRFLHQAAAIGRTPANDAKRTGGQTVGRNLFIAPLRALFRRSTCWKPPRRRNALRLLRPTLLWYQIASTRPHR